MQIFLRELERVFLATIVSRTFCQTPYILPKDNDKGSPHWDNHRNLNLTASSTELGELASSHELPETQKTVSLIFILSGF